MNLVPNQLISQNIFHVCVNFLLFHSLTGLNSQSWQHWIELMRLFVFFGHHQFVPVTTFYYTFDRLIFKDLLKDIHHWSSDINGISSLLRECKFVCQQFCDVTVKQYLFSQYQTMICVSRFFLVKLRRSWLCI